MPLKMIILIVQNITTYSKLTAIMKDRYSLLHIIVVFFLITSITSSAQEWKAIGPYQSAPNALATDTTNNIIYVGVGSDLYKSVDKGNSWQRLQYIDQYATWPGSYLQQLIFFKETLYVCPASGPIYTTSDKGVSWDTLTELIVSPNTEQSTNSLTIHNDTLYLIPASAFNRNLPYYYSTDKGKSWIADTVPVFTNAFRSSNNFLYAFGPRGIHRRTSQQQWELVSPDTNHVSYLAILQDHLIMLNRDGLFIASERDMVWKHLSTEGSPLIPSSMIIQNDSLYIYNTFGSLHQASLDGNSLVQKPERQTIAGRTGWLLVVDNELILLSTNSYRWNSQRSRWAPLDIGETWTNHHVYYIKSLNEVLYAATLEGTYTLHSEELGWERLEHFGNKSIYSIDTAHGGIYFNVYGYPHIYFTSDGGESWDSTLYADSSTFNEVHLFIVDGLLYLTDKRNDKLYRSLDTGKTWEPLSTFYVAGENRFGGVHGDEDVVLYKQFIKMHRSLDKGNTWELIEDSGLPNINNTFLRYGNGSLYFAAYNVQSYSRADSSAGKIIAGTIFRSDDYGDTWIGLGNSLPKGKWFNGWLTPRVQDVQVFGDTVIVALRDTSHIIRSFISTDRGEVWHELQTPTLWEARAIILHEDKILIATSGLGILQSELNIKPSTSNPTTGSFSSTLSLTFNAQVGLIEYSLTTPTSIQLALYSIDGREVMSLAKGYKESGTHKLPMVDIIHGAYLLVLQTERESTSELIQIY